MFVSQGLVDPKADRNSNWSKGKQVNIPVHARYVATLCLVSDALW
jgi:hypothetical protein